MKKFFNFGRNNGVPFGSGGNNENSTYPPDPSPKNPKRALRIFDLAVLVVVLIALAVSAFYSVQENEKAVITTFGKPYLEEKPGVHVKIPFIQKVHKVSTTIKSMAIGYTEEYADPNESFYTAESLMITSDYNFVNVDFFLEYRVVDPVQYLFASERPEDIFRNIALSCIRDTVGMHTVDEVITTGKGPIQTEVKEEITNYMDELDIGLQVVNVSIQDAEPPTEEVRAAFNAVEDARQGKDTKINEANKYKSEKEPEARAEVDRMMQQAEAERESRIAEAHAQVAEFNAMYDEYVKNPTVTKRRMFYEAMENVLPYVDILIDSGDGDLTRMYPMRSFTEPDGNASSSEEG